MFLIVFSGLKDEMLEESENLLDPDVLATDIVEDLECRTRTNPQNRTDLGVDEAVEVLGISEVTGKQHVEADETLEDDTGGEQ